MALFYVTGLSGTGKSAVLSELRVRGYHARGVDEDGYADWINKVTGTPDGFPRDARASTCTPGTKRTTGCSAQSGSAS
jgi:hypothetical protein